MGDDAFYEEEDNTIMIQPGSEEGFDAMIEALEEEGFDMKDLD